MPRPRKLNSLGLFARNVDIFFLHVLIKNYSLCERRAIVDDQPGILANKATLRIFVNNFVTLQLRVAFYTNDYTGELIESTLLDMYLCKPLYKHFTL